MVGGEGARGSIEGEWVRTREGKGNEAEGEEGRRGGGNGEKTGRELGRRYSGGTVSERLREYAGVNVRVSV